MIKGRKIGSDSWQSQRREKSGARCEREREVRAREEAEALFEGMSNAVADQNVKLCWLALEGS